MRKVIAAINQTLDGYCDHTAGIADAELHDHFTALLNSAEIILYGRITYQLMEDYWPLLVQNPSGERNLDEFAIAIDRIPKIVFSKTLTHLDWDTATLATESLEAVVRALKQEEGKDILIGSPSLIAALTQLDLIDEYQLCIHPVILGSGLPLFRGIQDRIVLRLLRTKTFGSGVVVHFYGREERDAS
jgi:dihydrofolate reductase